MHVKKRKIFHHISYHKIPAESIIYLSEAGCLKMLISDHELQIFGGGSINQRAVTLCV